ncbi:MAG: amidohydrolase family protein [Ilumatobacteraceae bacterium]
MTITEVGDDQKTGVPTDLQFIDADSHWTEPADLWSARVPETMRDRVPHLQRHHGRDSWILDGELWASTGANVIGAEQTKIVGGHIMDDYADIDPSAWSVPHRLALMDELGAHSAVVYPNGVGFASNHMFAIEDIEQRKMILSIYNDFFVDLQHESGNRLLPQAMLPIWDMDLTVKEMARMLDKGIRGFTLSDKPELIGLPELWEPYFDPMWDIFNESGAVANFHIGSGSTKEQIDAARNQIAQPTPALQPNQPIQPLAGYTAVSPAWREFGRQRKLAVSATQSFMSNVRIITNLCYSNLFDRYPKLQVVSAESGIGWLPFLLEAMDYQMDEMISEQSELAHTKGKPSDYFREHFYVMFWFEKSAPRRLIDDIGARNILVETDVPHSTCLYPGPRDHFVDVLRDVPTADVRRIMMENAAELYGIDI